MHQSHESERLKEALQADTHSSQRRQWFRIAQELLVIDPAAILSFVQSALRTLAHTLAVGQLLHADNHWCSKLRHDQMLTTCHLAPLRAEACLPAPRFHPPSVDLEDSSQRGIAGVIL